MINKQSSIINYRRPGVALLVVLFVVMVITITSLAFLSESNVELACGQNMKLRTEMDYTVESGLEHARGLIMSPQELLAPEGWIGDKVLELVDQQIPDGGGDDYYDLAIVRDDSNATDRCNYIIDCNSYRLRGGEKIGRSNITAELRLDPCIAYWVGTHEKMSRRITINGDMYCAGILGTCATINGDVFAKSTISGSGIIEGRSNQGVAVAPVVWPPIKVGNYSSTYYVGAGTYTPQIVGTYAHPVGTFNPSPGNPGGIRYRNGGMSLPGDVSINGGVVVNGNLTIAGTNTITAVKNFPALLVTGDLIIEPGGVLNVGGLVVVEGGVQISSNGGKLDITGALFTKSGITETVVDSSGNGNGGTLSSDIAWQPSGGRTGGALEFDGVHDYVQTSDNSTKLQLTADYTLSVWIKPDSTQKSWAGVFSKCDPAGSTNHWTLQFNSAATELVIHHPDSSWRTKITLSEIAGAWHHIGVIRRGNTMTSYLDGVARPSDTWNNGPGAGGGHFNIGADRTASSSYLYKGLIDDVRIYNCALDPNQICPPLDGLAGLIGHWRLDEGGCDVDITGEPCKAAIMTWSSEGVADKWEQVGGAFFRSIRRQ